MKQHLGYLYLHAPDPDNRGKYVTYRVAVEVDDENSGDDQEEEADDEQD